MSRHVRATIVLLLLTATAQSWGQGAPRKKTSPTSSLVNLIGKTRSVVEKQLGKPTHEDNQVGGGTFEMWGAFPKGTSVSWDSNGKMQMLSLPSAATWRTALAKYGLGAAGVKTTKIEGDGGSVGYRLSGVKGIPSGWSCKWYNSGLEFDKS